MGRIPKDAKILHYISNNYFADSHSIIIHKSAISALSVYLTLMRNTPKWITKLMSLRNFIVAKLDLKDLGNLSDIGLNKAEKDYKIGAFTLINNCHNEIIVEDKDKHLDVKLSFYIENKKDHKVVHASTVVHVKNTFGKCYMFFVTPVHKIIVPCSLRSLHTDNT
jgi:hypothetical protein